MSVGQPIRISSFPEFEGDAGRFEDFFCRLVAEVSPPLIRSSRASEQSAILRSANPWNWLLAVPVKFNDSGSDGFSQFDKGAGTALIQAMQTTSNWPRFRTLLSVSFLMRIGP